MSDSPETLGDAPIDPALHQLMNELGRGIDDVLNLNSAAGKVNGFVLMAFPFENHNGRCNYVSNATRETVIVMLKEQLARFEGRMGSDGTA